ncbi:MAG: hypothetical protein L6R19_08900 [Alphaproteobacteria bacterium]|nr:hypothetical protein [Alphaproteobacteria bacterium]
MSLKIGGRLFTGPFPLVRARVRKNHPACVFAIVCKQGKPWNPSFRLIAVGETGGTDVAFAEHASRTEWERVAGGALDVYMLEMPEADGIPRSAREALVAEIRAAYDPPHGEIPITGM